MSYKIKNERLANLTVGISNETVIFDKDGIGEISSEKIYEGVLELEGFHPVEEKKVGDNKVGDNKVDDNKVDDNKGDKTVDDKDKKADDNKDIKNPVGAKSLLS